MSSRDDVFLTRLRFCRRWQPPRDAGRVRQRRRRFSYSGVSTSVSVGYGYGGYYGRRLLPWVLPWRISAGRGRAAGPTGNGGNAGTVPGPTTLPAWGSTVRRNLPDAVITALGCQPTHQPAVTPTRTAADAARPTLELLRAVGSRAFAPGTCCPLRARTDEVQQAPGMPGDHEFFVGRDHPGGHLAGRDEMQVACASLAARSSCSPSQAEDSQILRRTICGVLTDTCREHEGVQPAEHGGRSLRFPAQPGKRNSRWPAWHWLLRSPAGRACRC